MDMQAQIGVAGLAVMGENLVLNMADKGFRVAVYNRTSAKVDAFLAGRGAGPAINGYHVVDEFIKSLARPRRVMMMVRAGAAVDEFIEQLLPHLDKGDIVIDGGNSHYRDTMRRCGELQRRGIHYLGVGISGGEAGALHGPSIMPGGDRAGWAPVEPIFTALAARAGNDEPCCAWMGNDGAGHFVKMVHNGIEYGDMQLIGEIYQIMRQVLGLPAARMQEVFQRWNGGELNSYLIEITADILGYRDSDGAPLIDRIRDAAGQKGTGKWTVVAALEQGVDLSLIGESVFARCVSAEVDLRRRASEVLQGPSEASDLGREERIDALGQALLFAKIISYAQGFALLQNASTEHDWHLDCAAIARIWRNGCIIRSAFLDPISTAFSTDPQLAHLLLAPYFRERVNRNQAAVRNVVGIALRHGVPVPCLAAAVAAFDSLRSVRLPANLLQAQRDYFGAHTYERVDRPRGEFFHTDWTGTGGSTTASSYSR